jgi:hypothetical protein
MKNALPDPPPAVPPGQVAAGQEPDSRAAAGAPAPGNARRTAMTVIAQVAQFTAEIATEFLRGPVC